MARAVNRCASSSIWPGEAARIRSRSAASSQLRRLRHRACHGLLDIDVAAGSQAAHGLIEVQGDRRQYRDEVWSAFGQGGLQVRCIRRRTRNALRCLVLGQVRCRTRRPPLPPSDVFARRGPKVVVLGYVSTSDHCQPDQVAHLLSPSLVLP